MAKKIALFNHKGGVSKTTTTFHLGWMLAEQGQRVILIDTDPQCNLTGLILGYKKTELEDFYKNKNNNNLGDALAPAFESMPKPIQPTDCVEVKEREGLFLLPGHIRLVEYDVPLGIAHQLSESIVTLQNLPGSINYLLDTTSKRYSADYILIDMNPSLSSINQNLLMVSNFFLVPTSPDYYSVMAIDSLATILDNWNRWSKKAQVMDILKDSVYPFPIVTPKFLGTIIQKYRIRKDKPSEGFQHWIDEINSIVKTKLVPKLRSLQMMLQDISYKEAGIDDNYCLASISEFNTLIATSQEVQKPIFSLKSADLSYTGTVLENILDSVNKFHGIFTELANKVIKLTSDESIDTDIAQLQLLGF